MPDDRYNGPRTDEHLPASDESSANDAWPDTPEPPATNDSWASDLWASTSDPSSDMWSPPTDPPDSDGPAATTWGSDLWASTSEVSTGSWASDTDTAGSDTPAGAPWVSDVWAATEPSPWVSDLWASTDPSTSSPAEAWSSDEPTGYADGQPPSADVPAVDELAVANPAGSESEPFWRSESWLLEPLADDTQLVDVTGDVDGESGSSWPDDPGTDSQPIGWDTGSVSTDEPTGEASDAPPDDATHEPVSWGGELGEDSEGSWSSYQRALEAPLSADTGTARPAPSAPVTAEPVTAEPPTNASDFAAQRSPGVPDPPTRGFPAFMYKISAHQIRMKLRKDEQITRDATTDIRRSIAGLRQITFTNPKGGSGKTTAALLTSMTLGQLRGGYILAWDNNETQGTLGVRARRDDHANTVRDLIADLPAFSGPVAGRVGDLAKYVRTQGDAMFDILASDEQAEAGEMMTAAAFQAVREVVGRFYKIICVDTGNNVRAANWAASIDSTDQLVVTASVRWESAYSASRMLDYLEQSGRSDLVSNAVTVLTMPASMKGLNVSQVEAHFGVRTREVFRVPFDKKLDNGDEIPFAKLDPATRLAWLQIGAAITRGL